MKWTACFLLCSLVGLAAATDALAQSYRGGIRGAVRDQGGIIPGAEVLLINEATNARRTTSTNSAGEYAFSDVAPGTYTLKTSVNGYKTFESRGLRVGTQQFITLDLTLEVGDIRESVTVTDQNPLIERATASVGESLDKATLERQPTAGRNPFFLSVTTPAVVPSGDPYFVRQQDQNNSSLLSLGGGPRRANNYTLDGVPITDLLNRAIIIPSIEALEEVKVQVSTYDAEMGRTGGGVFNATARSGANNWHGSILGQNRPQWGQSKLFFARNAPKPDTYFYLYGGSLGGPASGNSLASFLLGAPASGFVGVATPNDFFINYYAGYFHDDFRISQSLTLNLGLRYEFERGLRDRDNRITVGFDRKRPFPVQVSLPDGRALRGGLMYAGVDGYPTHQGDPSKRKFAPRVGFALSLNPETILRGGYGLLWSPNQYPYLNNEALGIRGFTAITDYVASTDGFLTPCATCTLTNPFPAGIQRPRGSANGLLTDAGGTVHFVDQFRKSAYVHQYSVDLQRELPGALAVAVGYLGGRSERLSVGGTNSGTVNINQLDPRFQSLGVALLDPVPNPFFGNPAFGSLSSAPTVPRGQLLRPYPQFRNILAHQVSAGKSRYNALVLKAERRLHDGWGLFVNYTLSSNKDNIFGESNFFSNTGGGALNNYDLDAEYSHSLLSAPRRLNITGTFELPFGGGKRWLSGPGLARAILGGWAITAIGSYQSGFPVAVVQNNNNSGLFGSSQRPNVVPGADPGTRGRTEDRLNNWLNTAAWAEAPPFTFGNAPRTDARVRTPFKKNWDIAVQKTQRIAGEKTLTIRAELINAFDSPNFLGPATSFGHPGFGRIAEVGGFPRLVQLMVRFAF